MTFFSIDYISAKYRGFGGAYRIAQIIFVAMVVVVIAEMLYLLWYYSKYVKKIYAWLYRKAGKPVRTIWENY